MLLEMACASCRELEGKLSGVPPHAALRETDRRDLSQVTEGRVHGQVIVYECDRCGACFTRDLDRNDPHAHWELCP